MFPHGSNKRYSQNEFLVFVLCMHWVLAKLGIIYALEDNIFGESTLVFISDVTLCQVRRY